MISLFFRFYFILFLFVCFATPLHAVGTNNGAYWVRTYGEVRPENHPLISRANKIFNDVRAVADIRSNRFPQLLVLQSKANPWAMAIPDGSILLSQGAIDICYKDVPEKVGDSRLAFILGHELAHQGKDDFWHAAAFTALQKHDGKEQDALVALLQETTDVQGNAQRDRITRTKELQADSYGLIYMSMAGYDPRHIFEYKGKGFFEQWVDQITGNAAYSDPTHPSPKQRAEFLESQLQPVSQDLDLFHFSVRLYQTGRIKDALAGFESFRQKYPGREVFNNLGLCHYQLALRGLASCGGQNAFSFAPATMIDSNTRAEKLRGISSGCLKSPMVKHHLAEAVLHLEKAVSMDKHYLPARINLSSALIVAEKPTRAMAVSDEALKIAHGNALAVNNKAIALYLFGLSNNISMTSQAITLLQTTLEKENSVPWQLLYNMAALMQIQGQNDAAAQLRQQARQQGPEELYADILQGAAGRRQGNGNRSEPSGLSPQSPIPLGVVSEDVRKQLADFSATPFSFAGLRGKAYRHEKLLVYAIGDTIEMVETGVSQDTDPAAYRKKYGSPQQILARPTGQTWCYDKFSLDINNGHTVRMVFVY